MAFCPVCLVERVSRFLSSPMRTGAEVILFDDPPPPYVVQNVRNNVSTVSVVSEFFFGFEGLTVGSVTLGVGLAK